MSHYHPCDLKACDGAALRRWELPADPDVPWQSGRICTTWPVLLTRGPLTEENGASR